MLICVEFVQAVNADLNCLGVVVGDAVDVFGVTHDRLRSNQTGIRDRHEVLRNAPPSPNTQTRSAGDGSIAPSFAAATPDPPGRDVAHAALGRAARWKPPSHANPNGLLLHFDGIPPYYLICFVTLGLHVRPSFRFVKRHRVVKAVPFDDGDILGGRRSLYVCDPSQGA